jgi:hypothetical protein
MPPMFVASGWANLTINVVIEMVNRLPCAMDRARMTAVCQAWLAAIAHAQPLPFQLPSLLLPPADVTDVYCYLSGGCRDHSMLPGPRHFGSYDGGWIFFAYGQTSLHRMINIRTRERRALPDMIEGLAAHGTPSMVILAATLSFPPDHPKCVAAGIVTYKPHLLEAPRRRHFAFWCLGSKVATCDVAVPAPVGLAWQQEDVVYYRDSFHFLTRGGHIIVCTPIVRDGVLLRVLSELMRFEQGGYNNQQFVRARYLVSSRGELLMVVRLAAHHRALTSSFKVFRMTVITRARTWIEEVALCGRMLFVGRGCSRSYEVSQYPGFKDGIFFLDDRSFYDVEMMFGRINERLYPCSDNGRWSPAEGLSRHVDLFFPERVPSLNSPPAWLLP